MNTGEMIVAIVGDKPNSLIISFNEHWMVYAEIPDARITQFISEDDHQRCLDLNRCWNVHYYPEHQVSYESVFASTLDLALEYMLKLLAKD